MSGERFSQIATPVRQLVLNSATHRDLALELSELKNQVFRLQRCLHEQRQFDMPPGGSIKALDFAVGDVHLCLALEQTRIVVPRPLLSPLPEAPPWIAGILNYRGQNIPVIDILHRFSGSASPLRLSDLILVAVVRKHQIGLLVHRVFDLLRIEADQLEQVDPNLPYANYVAGITAFDGFSTYLLSLDRLLLLADPISGAESQ